MSKSEVGDPNVSNPKVIPLIISLLQEFDEVFPKDGPCGLSLIRGIEHQIDFVLGLVYPIDLPIGQIP